MLNFLMALILIFILHMVFFLGGKNFNWDPLTKSTFECGYTSYFFSRFSFSTHYFVIALTFLMLDLELCLLLPFFLEEIVSSKATIFFLVFSLILTLGLIWEWAKGFLEWKN